ncbi:protease modulator HflC [Paraburkholderia sp. GAS42]|jgi:membrane protease subunit HflC|uniref:protease modulator HflC n=1 Tax=Paraburkholderia sp. GAS42 TaxID=3035135 RepID=UPI003D218E2C
MNRIIALVVAVVIVLFAASSMVYVVDQRHMAVVSAHGDTAPVLVGPGLHVKLPPPLQTATLVDTRIQSVDAPDADRYVTSDKIDILVNPVIRYRVADPLRLFADTRGDAQGLPERLATMSRDALGGVFAKYTLADALAKQQDIATQARTAMQKAAAPLGIDVIDVQMTRVDFPAAMTDSVYKRMTAAREQVANEERAKGAAEADQIKADAARQQQGLVADAYKEAQTIKGEGDGKAASIAADAFGRDPQFYEFYQSMQAYRNSFKPNDVIVVDPGSEFFRFMRSPTGGTSPDAAAAAPARKH